MKDGDKVIIKGIEYTLMEDYLSSKNDADCPAVLCPKCLNDKFQITFGNYCCMAVCECGHNMTVYTG